MAGGEEEEQDRKGGKGEIRSDEMRGGKGKERKVAGREGGKRVIGRRIRLVGAKIRVEEK